MLKKYCLSAIILISCTLLPPGVSQAATSAQADSGYNAFYKHYWNSATNTFYKYDNQTGLIDFWRYAHDWETMMDMYQLTGDTMYVRQMKEAWTGFNKTNGMGTTWSRNSYNDDIAWWILAAGRAYMLTKDTAYSNTSKKNFDWFYTSGQWDNVVGGGIYWRNNEHNEKNACINGPAACGAMYLYWIYGDTAYLNKAKAIYAWERLKLFNASSGVIADHITTSGSVSGGAITYNQGTFIGAAGRLFKATGDSSYLRDAIKAADYVKNSMSNRTTGVINNGGLSGDGAAFLIVFVRHMMNFIIEEQQTQYLSWMNTNADAAWKNRRPSDNIMSSAWNSVPGGSIESSSCAGGVAMVSLDVLANNPTAVFRPKGFARAMSGSGTKAEIRTFSLLGKRITKGENHLPAVLLQQTPSGTIVKKVQLR